MGLLKAIGGFFVFLLMGFAISAIFMALLVGNLFESIENTDKILLDSAQKYIAENKEDVKKYILEREEVTAIKKEQILAVCQSNNTPISKELCQNLGSMSEEEAKSKFVDDLLAMENAQEYMGTEISKFTEQAKTGIDETIKPIKEAIGPTSNYVVFGIIGYLISCGLIFALNMPNIKESLYKVSKNTFFNVLPFLILFWYISLLTPDYLLNILTKISGGLTQLSDVPKSLIDMMLNTILEILKSATNPLFMLSIAACLVTLAAAVSLKVLIIKANKAK